MSQSEIWTVKRLLEWTTEFFQKKGLESPKLDADILLATAMNIKRIELYTNYETEPTESQRTTFREFVKRRGNGEPVAYLVGFKEFYSISFKVNRNVLIPRPETEDLVLRTLDILKQFPENSQLKICDVGTGSGAVAVALAKNWTKTRQSTNIIVPKIIAVDISLDALMVAESNALSNRVAEQIEFHRSDLLAEIDETFDVIVSNPPYVSESEYNALPDNIKKFEPKLALLAGVKGTEIIERLIKESSKKLNSGGWLLIEGSPMIAESVAELMSDWNNVQIFKDNANLPRVICGQVN
jgi:release factor glutamine methyltransferase